VNQPTTEQWKTNNQNGNQKYFDNSKTSIEEKTLEKTGERKG